MRVVCAFGCCFFPGRRGAPHARALPSVLRSLAGAFFFSVERLRVQQRQQQQERKTLLLSNKETNKNLGAARSGAAPALQWRERCGGARPLRRDQKRRADTRARSSCQKRRTHQAFLHALNANLGGGDELLGVGPGCRFDWEVGESGGGGMSGGRPGGDFSVRALLPRLPKRRATI